MDTGEVSFSEEELQLFCEASGDRNPLHLIDSYASKTAYGQRVVYGALGAIACLGTVTAAANHRVSRITADFHRPMFIRVSYRLEKAVSGYSQTVRVFDGSVLVLTLTLVFEEASGERPLASRPDLPSFERNQARELAWKELRPDQEVNGFYAADPGKLEMLRQRWGVTLSSTVVEVLLWSSYFIGMELPGRNALFFRLALDVFQDFLPATPFQYVGVVSSLNRAIEQVKIRVALHSDNLQLALGHLVAFIRPELPALSFSLPIRQESLSAPLEGKVAVVLGASRGLGAALSVSLAAEGADVVAMSRSKIEPSTELPDFLQQKIFWEAGDCADAQTMVVLRKKIAERFGKLDFLVCNAFPPIPALRLEENALTRIEGYIHQSMTLVLVPLCALLSLLHESKGCVVIISSSAVEKPVREWPHYVAAKSAIESLGAVAPLQYPNTSSLIVRPTRLLTDMTNTPMGRQNAISPMSFAKQITKRLQMPFVPGTTEVFHSDTEKPSNVL